MRMAWMVIVALGIAMNAEGQGTFLPATYASDPSFTHSGGTITDLSSRGVGQNGYALVFGSGYQAQYFIGPAGTTDSAALVAVGPQAGFLGTSPTDVAGGAGYWEGNGNAPITTSFVPGSTVVLQLRAWKGDSTTRYATDYWRTTSGSSPLLQVILGNAGSPPTPATSITTMPNFALFPLDPPPTLPEPSTLLLGFIGAGSLFLRRRN